MGLLILHAGTITGAKLQGSVTRINYDIGGKSVEEIEEFISEIEQPIHSVALIDGTRFDGLKEFDTVSKEEIFTVLRSALDKIEQGENLTLGTRVFSHVETLKELSPEVEVFEPILFSEEKFREGRTLNMQIDLVFKSEGEGGLAPDQREFVGSGESKQRLDAMTGNINVLDPKSIDHDTKDSKDTGGSEEREREEREREEREREEREREEREREERK